MTDVSLDVPIDTPPTPVALVAGYSHNEPKTLVLRCHDQLFENAEMTDETGAEMFHIKSKWGKSWSFRRSLYDVAGQHVLDFRHYSLDVKNRWTIEDPSGKELASIEHLKQITKKHANVDLTIVNSEKGAKDIVVHMRQKDSDGITTFVALEGATVAQISMIERNGRLSDALRPNHRSVWKVRVAPAMDLALIMVMALCRAEMEHVWNK